MGSGWDGMISGYKGTGSKWYEMGSEWDRIGVGRDRCGIEGSNATLREPERLRQRKTYLELTQRVGAGHLCNCEAA